MDDAQIKFLQDMVNDSIRLAKENEIGQAFDKLARGLESLFNKLPRNRQRDKVRALFNQFVSNEPIWQVLPNTP